MGKIIEGVFTLERINEVNELLEQDKYVTMDSSTAFEVMKTILTYEQLNNFIINALHEIGGVNFIPLNFDQIRGYIEHEFEMLQMRNEQEFDINEMRHLVDNCEIYAQRYNIAINQPRSEIFIWRTPSQHDFEVAKNKISEVLESFRQGEEQQNIDGVTIMIRGKTKFIDINIENINNRAWVGFDFR
ncbi:MAG: hypothetical protein FJX80_14920 [Bacteroidetes bacterium]|nr:hypothetical protein [Bacteroidota bacterium]